MSSAPPEQRGGETERSGARPGNPVPPTRRDTWWPRAERRRRVDLVVVALLVLLAVVGVVLVVRSGDEASTTLEQFSRVPSPDTAGVPVALAEAWRAADPVGAPPGPGLLGGPVSVGGAVATGRTEPDGTGVVTGLDAATGAVAWEYRRPNPLCTVGEGSGVVLALFATTSPVGTFCSDVASFDPSSGDRGPTRNADVRPGTRLLADGSHVTATGRDYVEVWRDDLVTTLEYGALPTPVQSTPQGRAQCPHSSITVGADDLAVLERCPGEPSDRLSVLSSSPAEYDKPEDRFSVLSGVTGGRLVATAESRTALEAPDGTLRVYDGAGTPVATVPLGPAAGSIPDSTGASAATGTDAATDPAGQGLGVRLAGPVLLWWTGTATIGLDPSTLLPRWTLPGTLGPGAAVPTGVLGAPTTILVPVAAGLLPVDAATGAVRPLIPVDRRADPAGPVGVDVVGATVVEQRGGTVVGLRPPG